jgi:hypothetical protein
MLWTVLALSFFLSAGVGLIAICGRVSQSGKRRRAKKQPPLRVEP